MIISWQESPEKVKIDPQTLTVTDIRNGNNLTVPPTFEIEILRGYGMTMTDSEVCLKEEIVPILEPTVKRIQPINLNPGDQIYCACNSENNSPSLRLFIIGGVTKTDLLTVFQVEAQCGLSVTPFYFSLGSFMDVGDSFDFYWDKERKITTKIKDIKSLVLRRFAV